jgi:hypothetical protein
LRSTWGGGDRCGDGGRGGLLMCGFLGIGTVGGERGVSGVKGGEESEEEDGEMGRGEGGRTVNGTRKG